MQMVKMAKLLRSLESLVEEEDMSRRKNQEKEIEQEEAKLEESAEAISHDGHMRITQDEIDGMRKSPQVVWGYIDKLKKGRVFAPEDVTRIASSAARMLLAEPTLIDLSGRDDLRTVSVVGDLHGHFHNGFTKVLDLVGRKGGGDGGSPWDGSGAVVFNGGTPLKSDKVVVSQEQPHSDHAHKDFVDRGENSLEVVLALLLLKLAYPNNVYLNRGNHEDAVISSVYGYSEEIESRYGSCINGRDAVDQIWRRFVDVFASLPLAVKTANALIVHGGIPRAGFDLDELKTLTNEKRHRVKTMVEADDEVTKLIQDLMWSDPKPSDGVSPNEDRGCGVKYGPDIIKSFLARHGLKHLIRSHEPIDEGYEHLELDKDGFSAVTVFSAMNYPGGTGFNSGAIVRLHSQGDVTFESYSPSDELNESSSTERMSHTFKALANMVALHRTALEKEFEYLADLRASRLRLKRAFMHYDDRLSICATSSPRKDADQPASGNFMITPEQWADAMNYVLGQDLPGVNWLSLQNVVAPGKLIDYKQFLNLHCNLSSVAGCRSLGVDQQTRDVLLRNHEALLKVFNFLDTDGDGQLDREEFFSGIREVSKRNPELAILLGNVEALFDSFDEDGSGTIELIEFERAFQAVDVPYEVAVMMQFDRDGSGTIDREEFRLGLRLLEARSMRSMSDEEIDAMFGKLDIDGDGVLELGEFERFVNEYYPH